MSSEPSPNSTGSPATTIPSNSDKLSSAPNAILLRTRGLKPVNYHTFRCGDDQQKEMRLGTLDQKASDNE